MNKYNYLVIEGEVGRVFLSEKLCKMISTFIGCKGKHDALVGSLQEHQHLTDMFSAKKAGTGDLKKPAPKDGASKSDADKS